MRDGLHALVVLGNYDPEQDIRPMEGPLLGFLARQQGSLQMPPVPTGGLRVIVQAERAVCPGQRPLPRRPAGS